VAAGTLPVIDVAPLLAGAPAADVARQIEAACRQHGFFYIAGHGVAPELLSRMTQACAAFFALPQPTKMEIAMARAAVTGSGRPRWDGQNLQAFSGTYGDYLLGKVSKVFPQLRRDVLADGER
jgi:isopenicillin N synthase-like dioxygenase